MANILPAPLRRRLIGWVGRRGFPVLYEGDGDSATRRLGPEDDHVEDWRRTALPNLHTVFSWFDGYAAYQLDDDEFAGRIDEQPDAVEELLWDRGCCRNPLAALKTDPSGDVEVGSWMYREEPTADRQVHVMLFRADGDGTDLYAHEEYSAGHPDPAVAIKHYEAEDYDPDAGVSWVQEHLPVEDARGP